MRDGQLARINPFVDAYNAVSLKRVFRLGADDPDYIAGDICFCESRGGDTLYTLGQEPRENDPPKQGEIVYADDEKVLCRRWNWYQDARSPVTTQTNRAVVTIQSLEPVDLQAVIDVLSRLLTDYFAAKAVSSPPAPTRRSTSRTGLGCARNPVVAWSPVNGVADGLFPRVSAPRRYRDQRTSVRAPSLES